MTSSHSPEHDPTPGDWELDAGGDPYCIFAPPPDGESEAILIATILEEGEQSITNARVLTAARAMFQELRTLQAEMAELGIGSEDADVDGCDAVELLSITNRKIDAMAKQYGLLLSQTDRKHDSDESSDLDRPRP